MLVHFWVMLLLSTAHAQSLDSILKQILATTKRISTDVGKLNERVNNIENRLNGTDKAVSQCSDLKIQIQSIKSSGTEEKTLIKIQLQHLKESMKKIEEANRKCSRVDDITILTSTMAKLEQNLRNNSELFLENRKCCNGVTRQQLQQNNTLTELINVIQNLTERQGMSREEARTPSFNHSFCTCPKVPSATGRITTKSGNSSLETPALILPTTRPFLIPTKIPAPSRPSTVPLLIRDCPLPNSQRGPEKGRFFEVLLNDGKKEYVYCENGWIKILKRDQGLVSFKRDICDYRHGFGDPANEYMLALQLLSELTKVGRCRYRAEFYLDEKASQNKYLNRAQPYEVNNELKYLEAEEFVVSGDPDFEITIKGNISTNLKHKDAKRDISVWRTGGKFYTLSNRNMKNCVDMWRGMGFWYTNYCVQDVQRQGLGGFGKCSGDFPVCFFSYPYVLRTIEVKMLCQRRQ